MICLVKGFPASPPHVGARGRKSSGLESGSRFEKELHSEGREPRTGAAGWCPRTETTREGLLTGIPDRPTAMLETVLKLPQ